MAHLRRTLLVVGRHLHFRQCPLYLRLHHAPQQTADGDDTQDSQRRRTFPDSAVGPTPHESNLDGISCNPIFLLCFIILITVIINCILAQNKCSQLLPNLLLYYFRVSFWLLFRKTQKKYCKAEFGRMEFEAIQYSVSGIRDNVAGVLNVILIILIITKTPPFMQTYKVYLLPYACHNLCLEIACAVYASTTLHLYVYFYPLGIAKHFPPSISLLLFGFGFYNTMGLYNCIFGMVLERYCAMRKLTVKQSILFFRENRCFDHASITMRFNSDCSIEKLNKFITKSRNLK